MVAKFCFGVVGVFILFAVMAGVGSVFTLLVWNAVMPDLFPVAEITLWQAFLLNVLGQLLFKGSSTSSSS